MHDRSDRANSENNPSASSPDLDEMFGDTSFLEPLPNIHATNYLDSDLENTHSSQDSDFQLETTSSTNNISLQALLKTPIFAIQLAQYVVVSVLIIATLRGIHAVFGSSKAPKAVSVSPQLIITSPSADIIPVIDEV
jgi:hypothetical protein